jgi:hypothetical protein
MDMVEKHNIYIHVPSSQTFRSYVSSIFYHFIYTEIAISGLGFKAPFSNIIAISSVIFLCYTTEVYL